MKKDFSIPFFDLQGEPIPNERGQPLTLKEVAQNSLLAVHQGEQQTAEEKVRRWKLATNIVNGEIDVTPEEIVLIKHVIGLTYGAIIVGPAFKYLDA
jgi:hypothetical protein